MSESLDMKLLCDGNIVQIYSEAKFDSFEYISNSHLDDNDDRKIDSS